jgi:hypothetical protein
LVPQVWVKKFSGHRPGEALLRFGHYDKKKSILSPRIERPKKVKRPTNS